MAGRELRIVGGIAAAAVTLGVAELVAVLISADSTPLQAIGSTIVDHTPDGVREWVIQRFGTKDKLVLFVSMGVVALIVAGVAGLVERVRRPIGSALFAVFGLVALIAAVSRPHASWTWALPSLIGAWAGIMVLRTLIRRIADFDAASAAVAETEAGTESAAAASISDIALERRLVMRGIGIAVASGAAAGVVGRVLGARRHDVSGERAEVRLPPPAGPKVEVDPAADLRIPGLSSYLTPNNDFYRIDTALTVPQVSKDDWSLRIHGMVDREIRINYADLGSRRAVEKLVTLTCVSNPVGGDLIGNASWLGYRLDELLAEAGPHPDADMVLSRSIDGFTAGSPLAALTDGRDAMLAVGMNGEPLPTAHGYPARLVVPGLYGYVSATKWVTELEITRFDRAQAYWTRRGWSERGPIKTGTRIDTPGSGKLAAGRITVAGVAWAQHRGIRAVEVRVDNGDWQPARLAAEPSIDTWRQWAFDWEATSGPHTLWARSTDGDGVVQTADIAGEVPDGATGYASRFVRIG
ncbi:molybdopterin-dependent oxidoreductase [Nocardia sp. NBC_01503]|uniref:molybdopterin-dependent oxidoreductase n=1 Tax=Nocardia sp. NBC_01503 TaxID=2975997 RepID=UPI002E7C40B3|nr:molybdopterin-dependent oxidoreductase [Nocardia sp. NBC_01503]WTL35872.1 molybdopterin-dependent oxidoreductase [Nocardia sp. NBC_01503]